MRILLKAGFVLTMDDAVGDLPVGDVLIEDGRITEVAAAIDAPGAEVIDASGRIVIPGLVDGHRHVWQSLLAGTMSDKSLPEYMVEARSMYCGCFDAEDAYVANYLGGLESLDAGITSVVDHSHLQSSPEVARALASGLVDSGVGGVFCYGLQNVPSYLDGMPDSVDAVREGLMSMPDEWHDGVAREIREQLARTGDGRLAFGIALPEATPYLPADYAKALFDRAARLGPQLVTGHWNASYQDGKYVSTLAELAATSAFDTPTLLTHCNLCNGQDLDLMAKKGIGVCTCGNIEAGMGLGPLLAFDYRKRGGAAAAGVDIASYFRTDLFSDVRITLQTERRERAAQGGGLARSITPSAREALHLLTLGGARAAGLDAEVGSITPGKRADIAVVAPGGPAGIAAADPAAALLFYTETSDIETVLCAGVVRKRDGELVGVDRQALAERCQAAIDRINARYAKIPREMMNSAWEGMF